MNKKDEVKELEGIAHQLRLNILDIFRGSGKGHIGGSLSMVEIITALYFSVMKVNSLDPSWPDRDRFVLSKGHASAAWYAALAKKGFFPEQLTYTEYIKINGLLQEHSDMKKIPGVEMSSGALGQGLSVGVGMALAARLKKKDYRVFVLLGDGEMQEGQVWEALMSGAHYKLQNLIALIDYNRLQVCGDINDIMEIEPLGKKLDSFGWNVIDIDGNNMSEVLEALNSACSAQTKRPSIIICNTVKGKGVPFIENDFHWHSHPFDEELYNRAKKEFLSNC